MHVRSCLVIVFLPVVVLVVLLLASALSVAIGTADINVDVDGVVAIVTPPAWVIDEMIEIQDG